MSGENLLSRITIALNKPRRTDSLLDIPMPIGNSHLCFPVVYASRSLYSCVTFVSGLGLNP